MHAPPTSRPSRLRLRLHTRRALLAGFALGVGTTALVQALIWPQAEARGRLEREAFVRAVDTVIERHVDPVDADAAYARGLQAMVEGLDDHSHYLTRDERRALTRRTRRGVGPGLALHYARTDDDVRVEIAAVRPDSPAAAEHLAPGDVVLEIAGRPVESLSSSAEADALLTGREGAFVELVVQRRDAPRPAVISLELARAKDARLVTSRVRRRPSGDGEALFGIVEIRAFDAGVGAAVKRAVQELQHATDGALAGIVLDVRGNPGGRVDEALVVADLFVASGILTRTRGRGGVIAREERAHRAGTDTDLPLVVLQDRYSASASELLSVALQEHGRAAVVGERSYGKGSVQEVMGLADGSQLTLTTARYFSPRDRRIDGQGVTPDVHVTIGAAEARGRVGGTAHADAALDRALEVLDARRSNTGGERG